MSWFIYALLSVLFYSLSTIIQKNLMAKEDSHPVAFMIIFQLLVAAVLALYMLITKTSWPNLDHLWPNLIFNGIMIAIGSVSMFQALKLTEASEYTILSTSSTLINLISASFFLHEAITFNKILGTLLIISSIVIVTVRDSRPLAKFHKGHLYALLSALSFGIAFSNESYIVGQIGVVQNLVIGFFLPGIMVLMFQPMAIRQVYKLLNLQFMTKMFIFSMVYLGGAITIFTAYALGGDAGKIYSLSNSTVIVTVILAAIFLGERDQPLRKLCATLTAFLGIMFLR